MIRTSFPAASPPTPKRPEPATRWQILSLPFFLFLTLPLVALFLRISPTRLITHLNQTQVLQAITLSLTTTLVSALVILVFGTPVAYSLARSRMPFRRFVDAIIDLPTVLPPAVAGVALLMAFGRRGLFGGLLEQLDIHIAFTPIAVMMAQTFIAAPFYIKSAAIGFSSIDSELEQAAELDGASNWQVFRYVTIPLSWSSLLGGILMSWARALGEFGATIIFAGNYPGRTQTMPLAIYIGFEIDLDVALTLSVILVGFSFLALVVIKGILHRETF